MKKTKKTKLITAGMVVLMLAGIGYTAKAQTRAGSRNMMTNDWMKMQRVAKRLETQTDWFKDSLSTAFDNNRVDDTALEDEVMSLVKGFELATDRYRERVEDNEVIAPDVENLLSRALMIEAVVSRLPASDTARSDWAMIKQTLDQIGKSHNVAWVWTIEANPYWKTARVEPIFDRLDSRSDDFLNSFRYSLDYSKINGTKLEDEAIQLVRVFEDNMDKLEDRADRAGQIMSADLDPVLRQGMLIEAFMMTHNLPPRVRRDWMQVKAGLKELAMRGGAVWNWTVKPVVTKSASE